MLEERGDRATAAQLRKGELTDALNSIRATVSETADAIDRHFESILATERERVANAAVLAELLALMLNARVQPSQPDFRPPAIGSPTSATSSVRPALANIADFIDEMLAQERGDPARRQAG